MTEPDSTVFSQLDTYFDNAYESVDLIASTINADNSYTEQGKNESFERNTQEHRTAVEHLSDKIDKVSEHADNLLATAEAAELPESTDPSEHLATEMQANRILGRNMTEFKDIAQWYRSTSPCPARTTVIQELTARGVLSSESARSLLHSSDSYRAAHDQHVRIKTAVNGIYRPKLNQLTAKVNNRRADTTGWNAVRDLRGSTVDGLPSDINVQVGTWTPNNAEHLYRNRR